MPPTLQAFYSNDLKFKNAAFLIDTVFFCAKPENFNEFEQKAFKRFLGQSAAKCFTYKCIVLTTYEDPISINKTAWQNLTKKQNFFWQVRASSAAAAALGPN